MSNAILATAPYSTGHGTQDDAPRRGTGLAVAVPPRGQRLWRDGHPRLARDRLGAAAQQRRRRRHAHELRRRRLGRRGARRARARPGRSVAELAREHPAAGAGPARRRDGPARLRPDAGAGGRRGNQHHALRPLRERPVRQARARHGEPRRELDGRLHRGRGGDPVPGARRAARARVRGRNLERADAPGADPDHRPRRHRNRDEQRRPPSAAGGAPGHAPHVAGARGPPPATPQAGPRLRGFLQGRGQAGLRRRAPRVARVRLPRPAARGEGADADRLGREGLDHPGARRRRVRAPDRRQPQGRHDGHRPRPDGRAPPGVQRRADGVPRRVRLRRAEGAGRRQVTGRLALGARGPYSGAMALRLARWTCALAALAAAVPAAASADPALFDTANPTGLTSRPITGLQTATETVVGLDTRPATGQLFLVTVPTAVVASALVRSYTLDPATATATFVGSIPGTVPGAGETPTGTDFNPVVDRLRVVNEANENFRINPNNGALTGNDVNLTYSAPATGPVTAVAYERNVAPGPPGTVAPLGTLTTLYGIDVGADRLVTIGGIGGESTAGPNGGTVR